MRVPSQLGAAGLAACLTAGTTASVVADDFDHFESAIRPVLVERCYDCHSHESGKAKGGLLLDSRDSIRAGGDTGPAVVPGDPEASLLLAAISGSDPDLEEMPPKGDRLDAGTVADFLRWIEAGAPDPREPAEGAGRISSVDLDAGREFWAFQKPVPHPVPEPQDEEWSRGDIDRFLLSALDQEGLTPSPGAAPEVLLRRLFFDLIGLPPSPPERAAFLRAVEKDGIDTALPNLVDLLLASSRFGERWGRHWMDVARFAESSGKETDVTFPEAWRYRDYVIDALNSDVPYDRFLTEQIAGDLLMAATEAERARLQIAAGFLAVGAKSLGERNDEQFSADLADEQIDTLTRATMAQTVACARCHDHKNDPFSMEDYYAMAGVFRSTRTYFGTRIGPGNNVGGDLLRLPDEAGLPVTAKPIPKEKVEGLEQRLVDLEQERTDRIAAAKRARAEGADPGEHWNIGHAVRIYYQRGGVEGQLKTVDDEGRPFAAAMTVEDAAEIADTRLLDRGEISKPGDLVPRRFPQVIELPGAELPPAGSSGRLELAAWLCHPDHPLTARVMVNRIWHHLFGAGIVKTVDNFGLSGEPPSHPALLDHLALRFMEEGWSTKAMVREIVLSRAYRQSSEYRDDHFLKDPENRFLWRASKRRLEAEAIRDALLVASGNLDLTRPVGSIVAEIGDKDVSLFGFLKTIPSDLGAGHHRSVYLPVLRNRLPDILDLFDFADASSVTGARDTTNVPLQSLYLLNSEFAHAEAESFAARIAKAHPEPAAQVRAATLIALARLPDPIELEAGLSFLRSNDLAAYCQALVATAEFRNLD